MPGACRLGTAVNLPHTLFDPLGCVRDGSALLSIMIDPHARAFRSDNPIDLLHGGFRPFAIDIDAWYAPKDKVPLEVRDVAAQYERARLWKSDHERAVTRRMPRRRDEADRSIAKHIIVASNDLGRIVAKGFIKVRDVTVVPVVGTEHRLVLFLLHDPFRFRKQARVSDVVEVSVR